jgi:hypothetical protein
VCRLSSCQQKSDAKIGRKKAAFRNEGRFAFSEFLFTGLAAWAWTSRSLWHRPDSFSSNVRAVRIGMKTTEQKILQFIAARELNMTTWPFVPAQPTTVSMESAMTSREPGEHQNGQHEACGNSPVLRTSTQPTGLSAEKFLKHPCTTSPHTTTWLPTPATPILKPILTGSP